jgi:ATP-dependent helicase HrpB
LLGAVDSVGVTPLGRTLARLPVHPRLGRMLARAAELACPVQGAWLAALCAERDVLQSGRAFGGQRGADEPTGPSDLLLRLERLQSAGSEGLEPAAARAVRASAKQLTRLVEKHLPGPPPQAEPPDETLLQVLLAGFPDRVAARRDPSADRLVLVGGRAARLDPRSVVRDAPILVAHVVEDREREARIRLASRVTEVPLRKEYGAFLEQRCELEFDARRRRVRAYDRLRYRDLILQEQTAAVTDRQAAGALLGEAAAEAPRAALAFDDEAERLLRRLRFLHREVDGLDLPRLDEAALGELARELSLGRISFDELRQINLSEALRARLSRAQLKALDREAPERLVVPSGRRARLDYPAEGPPVLAVKLQELFGLRETPRLARGQVAVLIHLLAPNGRPVQVTRDLESFWKTGYPEVRRELRGRYPKHPWPEDPLTARPTRRTKTR